MQRFVYQANFCAECGNTLPARRVWWPRYFCDVCAKQVKRRSFFKRSLAPLGLLIITLGLAFVTHSSSERTPRVVTNAPAATVSALDATAQLTSASNAALNPPQNDAAPSVFCGARTKRGKPCRRL